MSRLNKFILAGTMLALTATTLVGTTYAFVILQNDAWVDEFEFNIETDTGLLVSLDGRSYYQDIPLDVIKKQIEENTGVAYTENKYEAVTLNNSEGKVVFNDLGLPTFIKDKLVSIPGTNKATHDYEAARKNDYLTFDLYFKIVNQGDNRDDLELRFDNSSIKSKGGRDTVQLDSELVLDGERLPAGSTISVDSADAMRLGLTNYAEESFKVYEPEYGLGSSAIEGMDGVHDKNNNLMYIYYNAIKPNQRFTKAADMHEGFNTISMNKLKDDYIGGFKYGADGYNVLKVGISIWLEGWDADFVVGMPESSLGLDINLGFSLKK